MQGRSLVQRGAQRAVEAVLEVERALPLHDVGEEVAVEGGVLREQHLEVEFALGRDELVEAHETRRHPGPLARRVPVVWVGAIVADCLEDHGVTVCRVVPHRPV